MSNIVKQDHFSTSLSTYERELVVASRTGQAVSKIDHVDATAAMAVILAKIFYQAGQQIKGDPSDQKGELYLLAQATIRDMSEYFPNLTLAEIEKAFELGIRQYYGPYYGLNVATFHLFVRAYKHAEERLEALHKQQQYEAEQKSKQEQPSEEQIRLYMDKACVDAYADYCKGMDITDYGGAKYNHLVERGVLNLTDERKNGYMEQAREQIKREHADNLNRSRTMLEARSIVQMFAKTEQAYTISIAKLLALKDFFTSLKEIDTDLTDLLTQNNNQ